MKRYLHNSLKFLILSVGFVLCIDMNGWGQVSYLGLDGGLEGSATIDNTVQANALANKWCKNNATQTITDETTTIRSGLHSLKVNNSSTTGRRVWSPNFTVSSTTSNVTVQYYRRVTSLTNTQESQAGIINNTEGLAGTYNVPAAINTWEKVTYTKASSTFTTISGLFMHRMLGTGSDLYIDDMCVYTGAVDVTAANVPTVFAATPSTNSIDVSWTAATGGVDGGGYLVVRGTSDPTTAPNANGIYALNNTIAAGMTVVYQGTGTSFTDVGLSSSTTYYYRIYTYDKAYNYSAALTGNATTTGGATPTITVGSITSFANQCTNTTSSEKSYSVSGTNLTANIIITPPANFEISLTSGSGFVANPSTLTLTPSGGSVASTTIYVVFKPTATSAYSANISHTSTGATQKDVAVSGTGICTSPTISTPTSTSVTTTTATLGGNITATGCTNVTERGIYWSTTNGFADGTGTKVSETPGPYSTGVFTINVSSLSANTVYYYKAFCLNSCGTVYTTQGTFTTLKIEPTNNATGFICGTTTSSAITFTWTDATGGQVPDKYLIFCNTTGSFTDPVDGTAQADVAGSKANINQGIQTVTFSGLASGTTYYFKIYPYTNSGTSINYKTDGTILTGNCSTTTGPLGLYPFTGAATCPTPNLSVSAQPSNGTFTDISRTGLTCQTILDRMGQSPSSGNFGTTINTSMYIEFTLTPSGGYEVDLTSMSFITIRTAAGATNWALRSSVDSYATDISTGTTGTTDANANIDLSGASYQNLSAVTFRIYPYGGSSTGHWRIDDITLNGTIVPISIKPEPTNNATGFTCGTTTSSSLQFTWTDATGGQVPDSYLILYNTSGTFTNPVDGTAQADGTGIKNVVQGLQTVTITGLSASTTYYFKIFPYTNTGTNINYKIDGTVLTGNCATISGPCFEQLIFTGLPTGWAATSVTYGSDEAQFSSTTGSLSTTVIANPALLTFDLRRTSSTVAKTMYIEVSTTTQGGTYTTVATYTHSNTTASGTTACSVDLSAYSGSSTVFIKFRKSSSSSTALWGVKNVQVYCGSCSEPTINPTTLTFSNITNTTIDFTIGSVGNGNKRIVFAKEGSAVDYTPVDGTTYTANDFYASTDYSGNRAVYIGTGSTGTITGLTPGTTYYFKVFEFSCSAGSENYYSGGTILAGNATTRISPVTGLTVECQTATTATISWIAPEGTYDGVVIGMRNSTLDCHSIGTSDNESTYTASSVFGSGHQYGSTTPYSFVVYKGTGTSVTVTGLTAGQSYKIMAYTFKNSTTWSATFPTTSITALGTPNVNSLSSSPLDAQVQISWANPLSSCFNEVMVVAKQITAVTASPTGDGSAYTANTVFTSGTAFDGGFVVYKGTSNSVIVTGLTNGTEYCFKVFTRSGTNWSTGVSTCQTPIAGGSVFVPGSIAVVGVCSNVDACLSPPDYSAGDDEISIVCFNDLTTGSMIDMTDNGWNRCTTGKWGNTEGYLRIRRTGADIPKGTIITFRLKNNSPYFEGIYPDDGWVIDIRYGSLILNTSGDQIYFMTGGTWNNGTTNGNNATYTGGVVLFGFNTNNDWVSGVCSSTTYPSGSAGTGASQNSGLYDHLECFNMMPGVATDFIKFSLPLLNPLLDGTTTELTQREWIELIKDPDNWEAFSDCNDYYNLAVNDFPNTDTHLNISTTGGISVVPGLWTGAVSEDWFYCGNWDNMIVPDNTVNVYLGNTVNTTVTHNCTIGAPGLSGMPSESFTEASCNNLNNDLSASGYTFNINHANSKLDVWGNFSNNYTFNHSAGLVTFKGTTAQTLSASSSYIPTFFNMTLNNSTGLTLTTNINISNNITLTSGILTTGTNVIELLGSTSTITETPINPSSYVTGNVKATRNIGTSTNQTFGGLGLEINEPGASNSTVVTRVTGTTIVANGNNSIKRYFDITPTTNTGLNSTFIFRYFNHEISGFTEADLIMFKAPSPYTIWTNQGGTIDAANNKSTKTAVTSFSRWTLASKLAPLPIELLSFNAFQKEKTVELNWSTASETNNYYFSIERSADGEWFTNVNIVPGAGNSSTLINYISFDTSPLFGSSYYRLKQVDYNGAFTYSNMVPVYFGNQNEFSITSFISGESNISFNVSNPEKESFNIHIFDITGKILFSSRYNINDEITTIRIPTFEFAPGFYCIVLSNNNKTISNKFVVH